MKYNTIVIDPPWAIGSFGNTGRKGNKIKPMSDNYKTMNIEDIKKIPIKEIATDNAFIFLWTTHTFLPECFDILKEWGFKFYNEIQRKFPQPYLDIFARDERDGWDVFGDEVKNSIDLSEYYT